MQTGQAEEVMAKGPVAALRRVLSVSVAVEFGVFWAWKDALISFMYAPSAGLVFSPLVCTAFASCLVLVVALVAAVKNRAAFSVRLVRVSAAVLVTLATLAGIFITHGWLEPVSAYAGACVVGCASATLLYLWADVIAGLDAMLRLGTVVAGICVSSLLQIVVGCFSWFPMDAVVVALGVLAFLGLVRGSEGQAERPPAPLMVRPAHSNHFRMLMVAIVMYAFVFGGVSGATAFGATSATMHEFVMETSWAMLFVSAGVVVVLAAWGRPVHLRIVGYFLTPVLAALLLLHIPFQGSLNGWLPRLTLGFWEYMQLFVLLLLIEMAQSGLASLSFTFPLSWGVVALGYAAGALLGQVLGALFGFDDAAVQSIAVGYTLLAIFASSIMSAARYPSARPIGRWPAGVADAPARGGGVRPGAVLPGSSLAGDMGAAWATGGAAVPGGVSAATSPAGTAGFSTGLGVGDVASGASADPIPTACADLVRRYVLSGREGEVLELLARGNTRASIAEKLCISENTVRVHVKNIYAKLHIHSKQQLIDMVEGNNPGIR